MTAYIALGANLGDRAATISAALDLLRRTEGVRVERISTFMDNPAVGGPPDSPAFLNAAAKLETTLSPEELLARLLSIETQMGRVRQARWEPRKIDLDLLLYDDLVIHRAGLSIPHPRMHERRFVLQPLAEVAPEALHPTFGKTIAQLLQELN